MLPDAIIIGDSHSNALKAGCDAHGLTTEILRFSGNFWHSNHILFHAQHGIWVRGLPVQQKQILDLRERLGGLSIINAQVPVIAAMAYHLGRIVPPFGFNGHVTHAEKFAADPKALYASQALVDAYVEPLRDGHIRMARRMGRFGNMTLVVPPNMFAKSNYVTFADTLTRKLRAAGVRVFDPAADICPDGASVPADLMAADGVHGNDRYGAQVIGLMVQRGLIGRKAA